MTKLTPAEVVTLASYERSAPEWNSGHLTPKFWGEDFDRFFELLPTGSRLLEIGCGAGRDAKELIAFGYDYTGTDISEGMLAQARINNPSANFQQMSMYDLHFDQPFDGFWCAAALLHIPKARIPEALKTIKRNMVGGAVGYISIKEGIGEKVEPDETYGDRFFAYWQNDEFKKVLADQNLDIVHQGYLPFARTKWLTYHVRVRTDG